MRPPSGVWRSALATTVLDRLLDAERIGLERVGVIADRRLESQPAGPALVLVTGGDLREELRRRDLAAVQLDAAGFVARGGELVRHVGDELTAQAIGRLQRIGSMLHVAGHRVEGAGGQDDVEQDEIERPFPADLQRLPSVADRGVVELGQFQVEGDEVPDRLLVFDDEQVGAGCAIGG